MTAGPLKLVPPQADGPPVRRLVLVDARRVMRLLVGRLFERRSDVELVGSAIDGPTGVCAVLAFRPDVAVIDLDLPGFDGLEACRQIRQSLGALAPRLILWSDAGRPSELEILRSGVDSFVPKHLGLGLLADRVTRPA